MDVRTTIVPITDNGSANRSRFHPEFQIEVLELFCEEPLKEIGGRTTDTHFTGGEISSGDGDYITIRFVFIS